MGSGVLVGRGANVGSGVAVGSGVGVAAGRIGVAVRAVVGVLAGGGGVPVGISVAVGSGVAVAAGVWVGNGVCVGCGVCVGRGDSVGFGVNVGNGSGAVQAAVPAMIINTAAVNRTAKIFCVVIRSPPIPGGVSPSQPHHAAGTGNPTFVKRRGSREGRSRLFQPGSRTRQFRCRAYDNTAGAGNGVEPPTGAGEDRRADAHGRRVDRRCLR